LAPFEKFIMRHDARKVSFQLDARRVAAPDASGGTDRRAALPTIFPHSHSERTSHSKERLE